MEAQSLSQEMRQPSDLQEYVCNAMAKASYQVLDDGTYYADVFLCPGIWATGQTVEECRDALRDVLSEWLTSVYEGEEPLLEVTELAWLNLLWRRIGD